MAPVSADLATLNGTPPRWSDLRRRLLSAALLVPPLVATVVLGGVVWTLTVAAIMALLAWEWVRLCRAPAARLGRPASPPQAGSNALARLWRLPGGGPIASFWLPLGLVGIAVVGGAMLWLRRDPIVGLSNTLFLCLVVAAADVGGYAFGRTIGGPRLAPRVSPNKTWAGAIGGVLSAMVAGALAGYALPSGAGVLAASPVGALSVAGLLAVVATAGDLFESWIKRRCDVKDTSGLIPGHGGLLDRLDGLLAAAPVAALLAWRADAGLPLWLPLALPLWSGPGGTP